MMPKELDEIKDKAADITKEILQKFGVNYLNATKTVIREQKEDEIKKQEEEEKEALKNLKKQKKYWDKNHEGEEFPGIPEGEPKEKDATYAQIEQYQIQLYKSGLKAHRPRPKGVRPKPPKKIISSIAFYRIMNPTEDSYCLYYLKSSFGKRENSIYHRYSDFANINKKLKPIVSSHKEIVLPEKSSKWGKRNLAPEFLSDRIENLNKYLNGVCKLDKIEENEEFLKFLGLEEPENPYDRPIFDMALEKTKYDINSWTELIYDCEKTGIAMLIKGKLRQEFSTKLNSLGKLKNMAIKAINTTVDTLVPPSWDLAYKTSKEARLQFIKAMANLIGKILELKKNIIDKLKEAMVEAFSPIKEAISSILKTIFVEIIPLILKSLSPIIKLFSEIIEPSIFKAIDQNDKEEIEEVGGYFRKKTDDIKGKLQDALDNTIDGICKGVTIPIDELLDLFNPIKAISRIISGLLDIFDPDNYVKVFKNLLEKRDELKSNSSLSDPELKNKLDSLESSIKWDIWSCGLEIGNGASRARFYLYGLGIELGSIPEVVYKIGYNIKQSLHKEVLKQFSRRFTDHVWEATIDNTMDTPWETIVDVAFKNGYLSAKKKFFKNLGSIIKEAVINILNSAVMDKVLEKIKKAIETVVDPIENAIPEPMKEFVNIADILNECVEDTLNGAIKEIIDAQEELFISEYNKAKE